MKDVQIAAKVLNLFGKFKSHFNQCKQDMWHDGQINHPVTYMAPSGCGRSNEHTMRINSITLRSLKIVVVMT